MPYSIELLSRDTADQWDAFNNRSPEGTFFHSLKWKRVLKDALHPNMKYYLILDDDDVVGISPWIERSVLNFRGLVDIPQSEMNNISRGGTCPDPFETDPVLKTDAGSLQDKETAPGRSKRITDGDIHARPGAVI